MPLTFYALMRMVNPIKLAHTVIFLRLPCLIPSFSSFSPSSNPLSHRLLSRVLRVFLLLSDTVKRIVWGEHSLHRRSPSSASLASVFDHDASGSRLRRHFSTVRLCMQVYRPLPHRGETPSSVFANVRHTFASAACPFPSVRLQRKL
jgi:hypothetical protein